MNICNKGIAPLIAILIIAGAVLVGGGIVYYGAKKMPSLAGWSAQHTQQIVQHQNPAQGLKLFIDSLQPNFGAVGTRVTIIGNDFTATDNTVNFGSHGGVIPNISSASASALEFLVPDHNSPDCSYQTPRCPFAYIKTIPGAYNVSVTNAQGAGNQLMFTVTAPAGASACLPSGITLDTVASINIGGSNKITVGQKLATLGAVCNNNQLTDAGGKPVTFYHLTGCWGNPPYNYRQILANQSQAIKNLQANSTVITLTCNLSGVAIP